jgi:hypothetical protein
MDIAQLTPALITYLAPHLPTLMSMGGKIMEGAASTVGEKLVEGAGKLWQLLRSKAPDDSDLGKALKDLAAKTDDPDLQAAARVQLKKLLAADPVLAKELAALLNAAGGTTITQNVTGKGNIVSAGDMQIRDINLNIN